MIRDQTNLSNEKVRVRVTGGRRTVCVTVMTGKGIHSRGRKSILKPTVTEWCDENRIRYEEESDHVKVYITVN